MAQTWSSGGHHSSLGQLKAIGLLKSVRLCLLTGLPRWLLLHTIAIFAAVAVVVAYGNFTVRWNNMSRADYIKEMENFYYKIYYRDSDSVVMFQRNDIAFMFANGTILMLNNETILSPTSQEWLSTLVDDTTWAFHCRREFWREIAPGKNESTRWIQHNGPDWSLELGNRTSILQHPVSALLLTHEGVWLVYHNTLWQMSNSRPRLISHQKMTLYKSGDTWRYTNHQYYLHGEDCVDDIPERWHTFSVQLFGVIAYAATYFLLFLAIVTGRLGFSFYKGTFFDPRHSTYFQRFIGLVLFCTGTDATALYFSSFWAFVDDFLHPFDGIVVFQTLIPSNKAISVTSICFGSTICICLLDDIWALVQLFRARKRRKRYMKEEIELSELSLEGRAGL